MREIFSNDIFSVSKLENADEAIHYGKGTPWCISGGVDISETSLAKARYYFDEYLKYEYDAFYFVWDKMNYKRYIICTKKNDSKKIKHIWDETNNLIDYIPGLPSIPEIGYFEDFETTQILNMFNAKGV